MAHSVESLCEVIKTNYKQEAAEIERTIATKDTCLNYKGICEAREACGACHSFIPTKWESHIYFNGEWWS